MSIYIDAPRWPFRGMLWSHMVSDQSLAELHGFARSQLVRYMSFGLDHYDIPEPAVAAMIAAGAECVDSRVLLRRLYGAGLRVPTGKRARTWQRRALLVDRGRPVVALEALDAAAVSLGHQPGSLDIDALGCFERPGTSVIVIEGQKEPDPTWQYPNAPLVSVDDDPVVTVVSRWATTWAIEFVIGEF